MRSLNIKAVSDLIATVLMITLSIMAASIVSYFVIPLVSQSANLSPAVSCIELKTSPPINVEKACFNKNSKEIELKLKRSMSESFISEMSFILKSDSDVRSFKCGENCKNCNILNSGSEKTYYFNFQNFKDYIDLTYTIDGCEIKTIRINQIC
jgi:hypothetical protein